MIHAMSEEKQLWCCSKVTPGDKLIAVNLGGDGDDIFILAFYISLSVKSIKQAMNAKLNSLLPKERGTVMHVYF